MRLTTICLMGLGLTLAACQQQETKAEAPAQTPEPGALTPAAPAPDTLTASGWGPLRIGMTTAEVTEALGGDSDPEAVGGPEPEACDQWRPERAPEGLLVMMEQGVLTRISLIDPSELRTDRGFGLGDAGADIRTGYGDAAIVEPHHYVQGAEYITVWNGERPTEYVQDPNARGIRYETDADGRVTVIHAGGPSIQYVEGCA